MRWTDESRRPTIRNPAAWCVAALTLGFSGLSRGQATFTGIGVPAGDDAGSVAAQVSADGSNVVGSASILVEGAHVEREEAYRWTAGAGRVALPLPAGATGCRALGVSGDGGVVVGQVLVPDAAFMVALPKAFRWTAAGGPVLVPMPAGCSESGAVAVSSNGAVVVGYMDSEDGYQAFRWTEAGGTQGLGFFPGGIESRAMAVSADGTVVVGHAHHADGIRAFRWTADAGMQSLGVLPGGARSRAAAVSADGSVVAGIVEFDDADDSERAFRWTAAQGMVELARPEGCDYAFATAVSADGGVVVGQMTRPDGRDDAFVWDAAHGMRSIRDVLLAAGVVLGDWHLGLAMGVSADGRVVVGAGGNPVGQGEAWRAVLPQP